MANEYIPIEWQDNISTPLSADNLNRMEQGIQLANDKATEAVNTANTANTTANAANSTANTANSTANTVKSELEDVVKDINKKFTTDSIKGLIDDEYVTPDQLKQALDAKPDADTNTTYKFAPTSNNFEFSVTDSDGKVETVKLNGSASEGGSDIALRDDFNSHLGDNELSSYMTHAELDNILANNSIINHGLLEPGSDINQVVAPGFYFLKIYLDYPNLDSKNGGLLVVYNDSSVEMNSRLYQMFIEHITSNIYVRHRRSNGAFSSWTTSSSVCHSTIPENTDLDTVTTPGLHYLTSSFKYINTPWDADNRGGSLIVYNDTSSDLETRLYQILFDGETMRCYTRRRGVVYSDVESIWYTNSGLYSYEMDEEKLVIGECIQDFNQLMKNNYITLAENKYTINDYDYFKLTCNNSLNEFYADNRNNLILLLPQKIDDIFKAANIPVFENTSYCLLEYACDKINAIRLPSFCIKIQSTSDLTSLNSIYYTGLYSSAVSFKYSKDIDKLATTTNTLGKAALKGNFDLYTQTGTIVDGEVNTAYAYSPWCANATLNDINSKANTVETMLKDEFLTSTSQNLFKGNWLSSYKLGGDSSENLILVEDLNFTSTAIIPIKPNKIYTVAIEHTAKEKGEGGAEGYYFKAATASRMLQFGEKFSDLGSYIFLSISTPVDRITFASGSNDRFLYVQSSKQLRTNFLVVEGLLTKYQRGIAKTTYKLNDYKSATGSTQPEDSSNKQDTLYNTVDTIGKVLPCNTLYGDFVVETAAPKVEDPFIELRNNSIVNGRYIRGQLTGSSSPMSIDRTAGCLYVSELHRGRKYLVVLDSLRTDTNSGLKLLKAALSYKDPVTVTSSYTTDIFLYSDLYANNVQSFIVDTTNQFSQRIGGNTTTPVPFTVSNSTDTVGSYYLCMDVGRDMAVNHVPVIVFDVTDWPSAIDVSALRYNDIKHTIKDARTNLFDGTYHAINFINGNKELLTKDVIDKTSTAKVRVKPNTTYSIFVEEFGAERYQTNMYYYFKVASAETDSNATVLTNTEQVVSTPTKKYVFTTGENHQWLFIIASANLKPHLQIIEGDEKTGDAKNTDLWGESTAASLMSTIALNTQDDGMTLYKFYDIDPRDKEKTRLVPKIIVKDGRSVQTFICDSNSNNNLDRVWRWYNHKIDGSVLFDSTDNNGPSNSTLPKDLNTTTLWNQTDCEGPFGRKGDDEFVGGYHGSEQYDSLDVYDEGTYTIPSCKVVADGEVFDADTCVIKRNCKRIDLFVTTVGKYVEYTRNYAKTKGTYDKGTIVQKDSVITNNYEYMIYEGSKELLFDVYDVSNDSYNLIGEDKHFYELFENNNWLSEEDSLYTVKDNISIMFAGNKDKCIKQLTYSNKDNNPKWSVKRQTRLEPDTHKEYTTYSHGTSTSLTGNASNFFYDLGNVVYYGYESNKHFYSNVREVGIPEKKGKQYRPIYVVKISKDGVAQNVHPSELQVGDCIFYYGSIKKIENITSEIIDQVRESKIDPNDPEPSTDADLVEYKLQLSLWDVSFVRRKHIELTPGKIRLRNTWNYLGLSDYVISRSVTAGLYSVWRAKLNGVSDNYSGMFVDAQQVDPNETYYGQKFDSRYAGKNVDEIMFYGRDNFTISIKSLVEKGPYYQGRLDLMESGVRYKAYFNDIVEH